MARLKSQCVSLLLLPYGLSEAVLRHGLGERLCCALFLWLADTIHEMHLSAAQMYED